MARQKKLPIDAEARLSAELAGKGRYKSTRTCLRGHVGAERFMANDGCVGCFDETKGRPWTGERLVDQHTPDREGWLAHRAAKRAATVAIRTKPFCPFAAQAAFQLKP